VKALSDEAKHFGKNVIQLKCPSELQANAFYERIGFQKIGQDAGRIRILSIWKLWLSSNHSVNVDVEDYCTK
jgi:hypothetical protein